MKRIALGVLVFLLAALGVQAAERKPYTRNVAVVVYQNVEILDFAGPAEVFSAGSGFGDATGDEPAFKVYLVSKTKEPVLAQGFIKVTPDYSIADAPKPDVVIIPGGNSGNVSNDPAFLAWVKKAAQDSEVTLTVCTGAAVMAKAGLLDGLEVTTWYGAIDGLRRSYPNVTVKDGRRFVDNGHYVTTAGVSAGIDGSLHVVARLLGRRTADQVARYMEYHWTPEPYLSVSYSYLNPSTSALGRQLQTADMYREAKSWTEAAAAYRAALADHPDNAQAWISLARALRNADDHRGAADAFSKGLGLATKEEPSHLAHIRYEAAVEYAKAGDNDRGVDLLKQAWTDGYKSDDFFGEPAVAKLRNDPRLASLTANR
jgi:putative intracellular protease/amidase